MSSLARQLAFVTVAASIIAACGSDDGGTGPDAGGFVDDRPIMLRGPCDDSDRIGRFRLEVVIGGSSDGSSINGTVLDRVDPTEARELVASEGDCQLRRRLNPLCEPACAGDELCSIDEVCVERARGVDVGPIRIGGLAGNLEMEARAPGNNYFDTQIDHPAASGGEEIRLRTTAGDLAIDGRGSEPLVITGGDWVISEGQPMTVAWQPPTATGLETRVGLSLSIDQHGTTPVNLVCEFDDDGAAEIPAAVIDQLFAAGVSGFPNASLDRRTSDSQDFAGGCVDLQVSHPRRNAASVSGHTPCNGPADCPAPQTCDLGSNTCVDP